MTSPLLNHHKAPRVRSVAYPSNTIDHCSQLTEQIYKLFGNAVYVPRERISEKVSISESHLQTQLSSCVQYGLLELKHKEGYKPTPLFLSIYRPSPLEKNANPKREAFNNPDLYKKIISNHNGETYTVEGLSTILFRNYKVSDNASHLAAKIFIENARSLGYYSDDNCFLIPDDSKADEVEIIDDFQKNQPAQQVEYLPPSNTYERPKQFNSPPIPIFLENGVSELYLPNGFNKADIERVIKVLKAYIE